MKISKFLIITFTLIATKLFAQPGNSLNSVKGNVMASAFGGPAASNAVSSLRKSTNNNGDNQESSKGNEILLNFAKDRAYEVQIVGQVMELLKNYVTSGRPLLVPGLGIFSTSADSSLDIEFTLNSKLASAYYNGEILILDDFDIPLNLIKNIELTQIAIGLVKVIAEELGVEIKIDPSLETRLFKLQSAINSQSQTNNMVSNMQKAKHDASMATIQNIR